MAETSLILATEVKFPYSHSHTPILPYFHTQCWEKLNAQFSSAAREVSVEKIFFKSLCFRAEAVGMVTTHRLIN